LASPFSECAIATVLARAVGIRALEKINMEQNISAAVRFFTRDEARRACQMLRNHKPEVVRFNAIMLPYEGLKRVQPEPGEPYLDWLMRSGAENVTWIEKEN
jgi:hypothetical protein